MSSEWLQRWRILCNWHIAANKKTIVGTTWNNISNIGEWLNKWESGSGPEMGDQGGAELRSETTHSHL